MTPLGKALEFYLKYPQEMAHLYGRPKYHGGDEPDLTGVEDPERVKQMAQAVEAAADQQVAEFLNACANQVVAHLEQMGIVRLASRSIQSTIRRDWSWHVKVHVTSVPGGRFWAGLNLIKQEKIVNLWLARTGGRAWAEQVKAILGDRTVSVGRGEVVLASIRVIDAKTEGGDVDRDALVARVVAAFAALRAEDIVAIGSSPGEDDDSPEPDENSPPLDEIPEKDA